jgi:glycosyltransferase involved in cell wall biosynthesis
MPARSPEPRVILLLSTYNGEKYLDQQLESLLAQTHENWVLYWRDDGSTDRTVAIMEAFAARAGQGRCACIDLSRQRCGPTTSFLTLLTAAVEKLAASDAIAFVDQDDVWLPHKLARGLAALKTIPPDEPALYCAPQILVDAALRRIGVSGRAPRGGAFPASLTQNIATGCTVMLNRAAAALVARSRPSPSTLHERAGGALSAARHERRGRSRLTRASRDRGFAARPPAVHDRPAPARRRPRRPARTAVPKGTR